MSSLRERCGPTEKLGREELERLEKSALECARMFQQSSSRVEDGNAQLSLRHRSLHRLSTNKLKALTAVHNYHIKREDGTTAAERFFDGFAGATSSQETEVFGGCLITELAEVRPKPDMPIKALNKEEETEYAPQEDDTLEKIVEQQEGITWEELALYNWRTIAPSEVNRALFETVGCKSIDAENPAKTVLSPEKGPETAGKILIPKVWIMEELEPDKTYAVQVRKQFPPLSAIGITKLDKWFIPKLETCDIECELDGKTSVAPICDVYGSKYCEASDWNEGRGTYGELENVSLFSNPANKISAGRRTEVSFERKRWRGV